MNNRYSDLIMDHFVDPRNRGRLEKPTGTGVSGVPGQGPFMVFQILCDAGQIVEAAFQSHNCGVTVACGSMLSEMVKHSPLTDCRKITAERLSESLGGLPIDKKHVAEFVVTAMHKALDEASA